MSTQTTATPSAKKTYRFKQIPENLTDRVGPKGPFLTYDLKDKKGKRVSARTFKDTVIDAIKNNPGARMLLVGRYDDSKPFVGRDGEKRMGRNLTVYFAEAAPDGHDRADPTPNNLAGAVVEAAF